MFCILIFTAAEFIVDAIYVVSNFGDLKLHKRLRIWAITI